MDIYTDWSDVKTSIEYITIVHCFSVANLEIIAIINYNILVSKSSKEKHIEFKWKNIVSTNCRQNTSIVLVP